MVKTKTISSSERISEYKKEYQKWFDVLQNYHTNRFNRNYKQYTAYATTKGTHTKISDPIAPELVERVIQKLFEKKPNFYALARGKTIPSEITDLMAGVASFYWDNPDTTAQTGTMKSKLKMIAREFLVTGNAAIEEYFNIKSDNPDMRLIPIEDVIFDPTQSLKSSYRYYIRSFVNLDYLEQNAEITEKGVVTKGLFKNIPQLKESISKDKVIKPDPTTNLIVRGTSEIYQHQVDEIELISVWTGSKLCQIANWDFIIRETTDPMQIGDKPLDFAMDVEVPKQPYALSMLDFLNGMTKAKDLLLNQVVDYGTKALNPPLFYDPSIMPVNRAQLSNAYKLGGLVPIKPGDAQHQPMAALPPTSFNLLTYIQQRAESVSGISAYTGGVTNEVSDKTQGTATGINTLINQAISPIADRQESIEQAIIEPMMNKWLKMAGALMNSKEDKFAYISGQTPKWVKITKGLLTGKITLNDLVTAGMISNKPELDANGQPLQELTELQQIAQSMLAAGKDPIKDVVFDVDWIVKVESGSMAENDTQEILKNMQVWTDFRMSKRILTDWKKVSDEMALVLSINNPERFDVELQPGEDATDYMPPMILPREVINFKDLPPDGQQQMASHIGIDIQPPQPTQFNAPLAQVEQAKNGTLLPQQQMPQVPQQQPQQPPMPPQMPQQGQPMPPQGR